MGDKKPMDIKREFDDIIQEKGNISFELKQISWYGRDAKYDIRKYYADSGRMGKGVTGLTEEGLGNLCKIIIKNELCDLDEVEETLKKVRAKNDKVLDINEYKDDENDEENEQIEETDDESVVNMYR